MHNAGEREKSLMGGAMTGMQILAKQVKVIAVITANPP